MSELIIPTREEELPILYVSGHALHTPAYHCRPGHLWPKDIALAEPEWVHSMEVYLANFCEPVRTIADEIRCVACNIQVTGHHVLLTDWRTKSTIKFAPNGTMEGHCVNCGYPCRLNHQIFSLQTKQLLVHLKNFPLFYHPQATSGGRKPS